jgi:phage terminase small subunit
LKLTEKQKIFCDEYIISLNATQAAIKAGYAEKTAYAIGAENLKKPKIQSYISERMEQKESSLIATQDEVLQYLTSVLRGESQTTDTLLVGIGDGWQEVQEVEKKPSEKDRLKAAELLGKRYGLYTDKVSADVDMSLDISIDYGDGDED